MQGPQGPPGSPRGLPPLLIPADSGGSQAQGAPVPYSDSAFQASLRGSVLRLTETVNGERIRVFSRPNRRIEFGPIDSVVQIAAPVEEVYQALHKLSETMLLLLPVALVAAGLGGALLADRSLRPVRDLTDRASHIGVGNLSQRLPEVGQDEFSRLSAVLNGMLQRLDDAFARERRFAADASHELKTPLAIIKLHTSLALEEQDLSPEHRKTFQTIERASDRANRIVQDLLLLAREGSGALRLNREPILVLDLLQETREATPRARGRNLSVLVPDRSLTVYGDRHHLVRLFTNLLENALRHTPLEKRITLEAARTTDEGYVLIRVRDTGEGIAPEHLPHLFEPFYRVDAARARDSGGSGLGLAICQSIARAHGGELAIESAPGLGTTVTARLPSLGRATETPVPGQGKEMARL